MNRPTPDATLHNPDPRYLRSLVAQTELTQREIARRIGISERTLRTFLADRGAATAGSAPYAVQYCLEVLARES